jgi:hypothetical protein
LDSGCAAATPAARHWPSNSPSPHRGVLDEAAQHPARPARPRRASRRPGARPHQRTGGKERSPGTRPLAQRLDARRSLKSRSPQSPWVRSKGRRAHVPAHEAMAVRVPARPAPRASSAVRPTRRR